MQQRPLAQSEYQLGGDSQREARVLLEHAAAVMLERRQVLIQLRRACAGGDRDLVFELATKLVGLAE